MARKQPKKRNPYAVEWTDEATQELILLCADQPLPVDRLPYTGEFNRIWFDLRHKTGLLFSKHHVFARLMQLRKRTESPKLLPKTRCGDESPNPNPTWWE